jgi:phosphoribosyl-ATP pyrophosphohydrolase
MVAPMNDSVRRLYEAVRSSRDADPAASRTARLLQAGPLKISKKLAEEAIELALEAAAGKRGDVIRESADLMYHLAVLWVQTGVEPKEIWAELDRREKLFGIAEKLPKKPGIGGKRLLQAKPHERERARRARSG